MKRKTAIFILLSLAISNIIAQNSQDTYTYEVGDFLISVLSESQSQGSSNILIGATPEMTDRYLTNGKFPNAVNAFLIRTPQYNILVDAGLGTKLFENLSSLGIDAKEINIVLITHLHGDHIGGMLKDGQKSFPNAKIYMSQMEHDYWMNDQIMNSLPENKRGGFKLSREVISAYKDKMHLFQPREFDANYSELLPGIQAISAYGHTPGHTMFLLESNFKKFLIWGDLTHAMSIQMPFPHIAVTYDSNPETAIASREKVLKYVSMHKIPIGGMHIAYPAMGTIEANNAGGYRFIPCE